MRTTIHLFPWLASLSACAAAPAPVHPAGAPAHATRGADATSRPAAASDIAAKVDALLAPWNNPDGPGLALAVVRSGKLELARGVGSANLEHGVAITPATVFQLASVAKQFTAFAVVLLAEQGKLSLDDDVRRYVPEVPDLGQPITLRQLIHHTSGLRDQRALWLLAGGRMEDAITQADIMALVRDQRALDFEPGREMQYSNTNYTLLAEVVARVTGRSFREWTTDNIFQPLGMHSTVFQDDYQAVVRHRADSYSPQDSGFVKDVMSSGNVGPSGLLSTVEDLARWVDNLDTGRVGGARVIARMHERGVLQDGRALDYAAGLLHGEHRKLPTVWHGGGDAGFRAMVIRYPEQRFAVIALANRSDAELGKLTADIAELYLEKDMLAAEAAAREAAKQPGAGGSDPTSAPPAADLLDQYAGRFQLENGMIVEFVREGDNLVAFLGKLRIELVASGAHTFRVRGMSAAMEFQRDETGKFNRMRQLQGEAGMQGKRIARLEPTEQELSAYLGTYDSPELHTSYDIALESGRLVARHRRHGTIELTPSQQDEFTSDEWYFAQLRFVRDRSGKVTGLRVSNIRVRDLRFDRR